jgi:hypothetical protein
LALRERGQCPGAADVEKAVALDPQYAEAYTGLGRTYYQEWIWGWSADPQTLERSLALAQQALALDDSLPGAHSLLSNDYALKQQYDQALAEGERAIALDPNNADSYAWQAEALSFAGRPEEPARRHSTPTTSSTGCGTLRSRRPGLRTFTGMTAVTLSLHASSWQAWICGLCKNSWATRPSP